MDIKIGGITAQIMREALEQARRGRLFILDKMNEVIQTSRTELSEFAPRFYTLQIPTDKIRDLIGPGGKVIRGIVEQTGVKIDVEDSGKVNVASSDQEAAKQALKMIQDITATAEVGKTYLGTVTRLAEFGAFVEIIPGTDGLLHISEVAEHRIKDVKDELHEGDQVLVKVLAVDGNRIKLSRKAVLKEQRAKMAAEARGRRPGRRAGPAEAGAPGGVTFEGGYEGGPRKTPEEGEPNFNREDAPGAHSARPAGGDRGDRGDRGPRPHGGGGGGGGRNRRRGGGGGGGGRGGHGGHGGGGGRGRG